jgi:ketosteroid isomerase-like protein
VELVLGLIPPPNADLAQLVRDDELWAQLAGAIGPFFHPDFECFASLVGDEHTYRGGGLEAFRDFWREWLAPWADYRLEEIEQAIDCGDRVLVIVRDAARPKGAEHVVRGRNAGVWTLRERQAIRWEGYPNPAEAFEAVGLKD